MKNHITQDRFNEFLFNAANEDKPITKLAKRLIDSGMDLDTLEYMCEGCKDVSVFVKDELRCEFILNQ